MGQCYITRRGSTISNRKIIYNLPLTYDLNDVSGCGRTPVYSGSAPNISSENGIYLERDYISLGVDFLNDISDNKFTVEFDFKYGSTSKYSRIFLFGNICAERYLATGAGIAVGQLYEDGDTATEPIQYKYNDNIFHHLTIEYNLISRTASYIIDDNEGIGIIYADPYFSDKFNDVVISNPESTTSDMGFYGYIKNFLITTSN